MLSGAGPCSLGQVRVREGQFTRFAMLKFRVSDARSQGGDDMHLHILGIGGTFMGGLAKIARERGHTVTGCDAQVYPPMSDQLRALGIQLHEGYDAAQLDQYKADLYVVGNAMTRGKPVIEAML